MLLQENLANGVRRLTLNEPAQYNTLSESMLLALLAALDEAQGDDATRSVVIAANGKAFCAGHNLKDMMANNSQPAHLRLFLLCSKLMHRISSLTVPVIAQVNGVATAAGCQLVAQCDLAVASTQAQFAVSGIRLGLFCATPSVALSRNVGRKMALEMLFTGDFVDANTAQQEGLVNRVVAPEALDAEVARLCASIAARPKAAIASGKALFYKQLEMGSAGAYQLAASTMACDMMTDAAQTGVSGFVNKAATSSSTVTKD
jgi:enoyl-CoA hydratase/carnithine racemase